MIGAIVSRTLAVLLLVSSAGLVSCHKPAPGGGKLGASVIPNNATLQQLTATTGVNTQLLAMPQAMAGGVPPMTHVRSQAAATGSNVIGADMGFVTGASDGTALPSGNQIEPFFWWSQELTPGSCTNEANRTGCNNLMLLKSFGLGGTTLLLGGGTNGGGAGQIGVQITTGALPLALATEGNSPITLQPNGYSQGQAGFVFSSAPGDVTPTLSMMGFGSTYPQASEGNLRLPWGDSNTDQEILDQRNSANTDDFQWLSRLSGVATYGNLSENSNVCSATTENVQLLNGTGSGLTVTSMQGATGAALGVDTHSTWVQGEKQYPCTHDCWVTQVYTADTAANSQQTIATIPITSGSHAITQLKINVEAREVSTGDFATFTEAWTYDNNAGSIVAPSGSQPAATDTGHSTAATGIAPQFATSGSNVLVKATPWTTSAVHWLTKVEMSTDMGAATAPTIPSGAVLVVTSTAQSLGAVSTWTDQSGNGNNLTHVTTGMPTNTANAGPGGNTNAVLFTSGTWMALRTANNALIGTKNFTIALVAQVTSTANQNVFVSSGDAASGVSVGVGLNATATRDVNDMGKSVGLFGQAISDGPATTAWEAWVYTSDSSGNLSLMVNGVPKTLAPGNSTAISPSANFYVGSWTPSTGQLGGGLAEIDVWTTAQNPAAVYAYQHQTWGL
jgi:hypothetical protein